MTEITLPWPARVLSPNARVHRMERAAAVKLARHTAFYLARCETVGAPCGVKITFHPPDNRRRDLDNMHSSLKPWLDGIADAIGVDDSEWNPVTLIRGPKVKGGRVLVEFRSVDDVRETLAGWGVETREAS